MSDIQLHDPQTLYRRWEDSSGALRGRPLDRPGAVAEERITTKFAGLVAAHAPEEETTFLATQQVDEARHMQ